MALRFARNRDQPAMRDAVIGRRADGACHQFAWIRPEIRLLAQTSDVMPMRVVLDQTQRRDERNVAALVVSNDRGQVGACRGR
jgi:hypothetical protein